MNDIRILFGLVMLWGISVSCTAQLPTDRDACESAEPVQLRFASQRLISRQLRPLFCAYRTLDMKLRNSSHGLIVELCQREPLKSDRSSVDVVVRHTIKSIDEPLVIPGSVFELPIPADEQVQAFALVFLVTDQRQHHAVTEIQWISKLEADYFLRLSQRTDRQAQIEWLLQQEAGPEKSISDHALEELKAIPKDTLFGRQKQQLRTLVLQRLQTSDLAAERRHFYLDLLGYVGQSEDASQLEPYLFSSADEWIFTAVAAESFLRLGNDRARERLIDHHFSAPIDDREKQIEQTRRLYPVYQAIRRVDPDLIHRAEIGEYLIRHSAIGDLVLQHALEDADARYLESAIQMYQQKELDPYFRDESLIYLAGIRDFELTTKQRGRIAELLEVIKENDVDLYRLTLQRLDRRRKFLAADN